MEGETWGLSQGFLLVLKISELLWMSNFPGLSVKAILKIIKQLQLLYHQIQSVWCRVCVWQPRQTSVFWSMSPFYSSAPSHLGNSREDGLVFMSLLPHGTSFQPNCLSLALLYYGKCAEAACKCHLPSNWWCQGPSKKNSTIAWNQARADGRQVSAAGRDSLVFLLRNLISPLEFPLGTWLRASAHTRWDRLGLLIILSAWCTQNQETKPCWRSSHAKYSQVFVVVVVDDVLGRYFEFKGNIKANWESRTFCLLLG